MADATNGFSIQQDGVGNEVNYNGNTYVSWMWKGGSSNTSVSAGGLNSAAYDQTVKWSGNNNATTGTVRTESGTYYDSTYTATELFSAATTVQVFPASPGQWIEWTPANGAGGSDGTAENYTFTSTVEVYATSAQGQVFTFKDSDDNTTSTTITSTGWTTIKTGGGVLKSIKSQAASGQYSHWSGIRIDGKWLIDSDVTPTNVPTIPTTYRANPDAGFSIVTYTGNNTNPATVAHGLNAKPAMIIVKNRETAGKNWVVYHKALGATKYLYLNTDAAEAASAGPWNNTEPTSTVWTMQDWSDMNNTDDFVAYIWSEVEGYSKFGTYEGNGNADGPFVWCGFRPAFVMIKKYNTTDNWLMWDDERSAYNPADVKLAANLTDEENSSSIGNTSYNMFDLVSNGFKIRSSASSANGSSDDFVFAAFADSPFKYANAR